jgi:hypothetical protein
MAVRKKADNYRQNHNRDSMELKKKIIELENIVSIRFLFKINNVDINGIYYFLDQNAKRDRE